MSRHLNAARLMGVAALALAAQSLGAGAAQAATEKAARSPCFFFSQWEGWKSPSPRVIYLGVNLHEVYRLDLAADSSQLQWPDAHLISIVRGSSSICSPLDLQLSVGDSSGFRTPLFPSKLTKLTPEEVAAIPKKFRPN